MSNSGNQFSRPAAKRPNLNDASKSLSAVIACGLFDVHPPRIQFVHIPVQKWQTRLLRLHPSTESGADLKGELAKANLVSTDGAVLHDEEHLVTYECLSYTWGYAGFSERIILSGQVLSITSTLAEFLREYRKRKTIASGDTAKPEWLWIDQICIDQRNLDEKSMQVGNMMTIYSKANSVIAWLGEATDCTEYAAQTLRDNALPITNAAHYQVVAEKVSKGLLDLYTRPWLRRLWVRQEVWATSSLSIWCGSTTIEPYAFLRGREFLNIDKKLDESDRRAMNDLGDLAHSGHLRAESIFSLLKKYVACESSDPRDRIYALVGMSAETKILEIDYNKSTEEVFAGLTHLWIKSDDSGTALEILPSIGFPDNRRLVHLPSWVPDLRLGVHWNYQDQWPSQSYEPRRWKQQVPCRSVDDWRILVLHGWIMTSVLSNDSSRFSSSWTKTGIQDLDGSDEHLQYLLEDCDVYKVLTSDDLICFAEEDLGESSQATAIVLRPEKQATGTGEFRYVGKFASCDDSILSWREILMEKPSRKFEIW